MNIPIPAIAAAIAASWLPAAASGQALSLPAAFDMVPPGVSAQPGKIAVGPTDLFTGSATHGFSQLPVDAQASAGPGHDIVDRDDEERMLFATCVRVAAGTEFLVRIDPDRKVRARVVLALTPPIVGLADTTGFGFGISASKGAVLASVAEDIDLRTPYFKVDLTTQSGSYRKVWFTARSASDGVLRIRFSGGGGIPVPIAAVEIHPYEPAPLVYRRQGATFLEAPGGAPVPGLDLFHAHDCEGAKAAFLAIADPLLRAYALAWLAGWICPCELGHPEALDAALVALSDPTLQASARARELRDRIEDYRLAELHESLRLYSEGSDPPPLGYGYFNTDIPGTVLANPLFGISDLERHDYLASTLYSQMIGTTLQPVLDLNAGQAIDPDFEVPPLAFRSLFQIARIYYAHNPNHSIGQNAQANLAVWEGILNAFDSGGFLSFEFGKSAELQSLSYMARPEVHQHAQTGGLQKIFSGADIPPSIMDPADAWWSALIAVPSADPPGTPAWASKQRRALEAVRAAAEWWLDRREKHGELGGGPGDDPELVPVLAIPFLALRSASDDPRIEAFLRAADAVLEDETVQDGYYAGPLIDVEHSAEPTSYSIFTALSLLAGEPHYLQACLDVAKHLNYAGAPEKAWCEKDQNGDLRFSSYWFNAFGPSDPADPLYKDKDRDVPLCGRALIPLHLFLSHSPHQEIEGDLASWAEGWKKLALNPTPGRPAGLVPASVRAKDLQEGFQGQWWKADSAPYDFPNDHLHLEHIYGAAFPEAYAQGGPSAHEFLLPHLRVAKGMIALKKLIDQGAPPSDIAVGGSENWALDKLLQSTSFLSTLAMVRPELLADPVLSTTDDPAEPGPDPYVTPAFAADLNDLLNDLDGSYQTYLTTPQEFDPVQGWDNKDKGALIQAMQRTEAWLRNYFPLGTSAVRYTDRAFVFIQGAHQILFGMLTGGRFGSPIPRHMVTWESTAGDPAPLDVALLVNDYAPDDVTGHPRLRILALNFESASRELGFRLWHRLPLGRYHLRYGKADNGSDYFVATPTQVDIDFVRRGDLFSLPLAPGELTLIELEWFQGLSPLPAFDVAVSSRDARVELAPGGPLGVVVRVTEPVKNTGDQAAPASSVKARAGLRDPNGQLVPLDSTGATLIDVPLATAPASLPPASGFALPSSDAVFELPILAPLITLWLAGFSVEVRFEAAVADFDPSNDTAVLSIDLDTILGL